MVTSAKEHRKPLSPQRMRSFFEEIFTRINRFSGCIEVAQSDTAQSGTAALARPVEYVHAGQRRAKQKALSYLPLAVWFGARHDLLAAVLDLRVQIGTLAKALYGKYIGRDAGRSFQ